MAVDFKDELGTSARGGVEPYLRSTGLGQDDLDRLRDRLLAPAGGPR